MKNLIFIISLFFSFNAVAETIRFNAGLTHESCAKEGVDRICDIYPLAMEDIEISFVNSDYGFAEVKRQDSETGTLFSAYFSVVRYEEEDKFFDLYIAFKSKGDKEAWSHSKVRLRSFDHLNHLVLTGATVKSSNKELTAKLFIAPR